mmetsp:Transcript_47177/g.151405  ORF Transcript_47177/g.151405 Transcript_47177/m.151405 type:complete len:335 (+) Transcript_47177:865-1869(+)
MEAASSANALARTACDGKPSHTGAETVDGTSGSGGSAGSSGVPGSCGSGSGGSSTGAGGVLVSGGFGSKACISTSADHRNNAAVARLARFTRSKVSGSVSSNVEVRRPSATNAQDCRRVASLLLPKDIVVARRVLDRGEFEAEEGPPPLPKYSEATKETNTGAPCKTTASKFNIFDRNPASLNIFCTRCHSGGCGLAGARAAFINKKTASNVRRTTAGGLCSFRISSISVEVTSPRSAPPTSPQLAAIFRSSSNTFNELGRSSAWDEELGETSTSLAVVLGDCLGGVAGARLDDDGVTAECRVGDGTGRERVITIGAIASRGSIRHRRRTTIAS